MYIIELLIATSCASSRVIYTNVYYWSFYRCIFFIFIRVPSFALTTTGAGGEKAKYNHHSPTGSRSNCIMCHYGLYFWAFLFSIDSLPIS
jgi:hypothetical protein